ncbi:MAG: hypothetical protein V3V31_16230 [Methylococcales bacterium]
MDFFKGTGPSETENKHKFEFEFQKEKSGQATQKPDENAYYDASKVTLSEGQDDIENSFSIGGMVNNFPDYIFSAKVFDEGSIFGIENGRLSKLTVHELGNEIINYQRGWAVGEEPENLSEEHKTVLDIIVSAFPEMEQNIAQKQDIDEIGEHREIDTSFMDTEEFAQGYREFEMDRVLDEYKGEIERVEPVQERCPNTNDMFKEEIPAINQNPKIGM